MTFDHKGNDAELHVYLDIRQDTATIHVAGDLDCFTVDDLRTAFDQVEPFAGDCVALDLHKLRFIDSRGIQTLLDARDRARANGYDIRLVGPLTPIVQRIMNVTGMEHALRRAGSDSAQG